MRHAILITYPDGTQQIVGPYTRQTTADRRVEELVKFWLGTCEAVVFPMLSDSARFGKPLGNLTNH